MSERQLPATYKQRGNILPLTTPLLFMTRLRASDAGPVFLIQGFGDGKGAFVLPFESLPGLCKLTVFDQALYERLQALPDISSAMIESEALDIAETGIAGVTAMRRARAQLEGQQAYQPQCTLERIHTAIAQLSDSKDAARKLSMTDLSKRDGMAAARKALSGFAKKTDRSTEQVFESLEDWGKILMPVGPQADPYSGSLQQRLDDLKRVGNDLRHWLIPEPVDEAERAQRIALAMKKTAGLAQTQLDRLARYEADMGASLKKWPEVRKLIRHLVDQLYRILDGWQMIVARWDSVIESGRHEQRAMVRELAAFLPLMPKKQLGNDDDGFWEQLKDRQDEWIKETNVYRALNDEIRFALKKHQREVA